jgi:membrane associated rhomboid family serine protease
VGGPTELPVCVRHPDRPTGLRCSRCERPACADCLREAAVGFQCVDCVLQGRRATRRPTTVAGASVRPAGRPVVVQTLIGVNVAVFVLTAVVARSLINNNNSTLFNELALWPDSTSAGAWWQLVTAGFLHYGPIHIAMNMVSLWIIGRDLELVLGRLRFTLVYFVALFGGSVAVYLFSDPQSQVAGASGAVFGLMGGVLVTVYRLKQNPSSVIALIAINLVLSFELPGISWVDHLGGLVVGGLTTAAFLYAPAVRRTAWQYGAVGALFVVLIVLVVVRTAQFTPMVCSLASGVCNST